jgi:DNA adenine methylase
MLFIDPPYFKKGPGLYTSFYKPDDHSILAKSVLKVSTPWVVTYDDTPEIRSIYKERRQFSFDVNYTLQDKRLGTELLIASKGLRMPSETRDRRVNGSLAKAA